MKTNKMIKSRINKFFEHAPTPQADYAETDSWSQYLRTGGNWCCGLSLIQSIVEIDRLTRIENEKTQYSIDVKKASRKWFGQHTFPWNTESNTEVFCN